MSGKFDQKSVHFSETQAITLFPQKVAIKQFLKIFKKT